ncbi:MAG: hypothetical protein U0V73_06015 [Acidimicrobiia bacterium]
MDLGLAADGACVTVVARGRAALDEVRERWGWLNVLVNTVSPGSFLSAGMHHYLESLPPERGVDPDSLEDARCVIAEDFGHPAHLPRAPR